MNMSPIGHWIQIIKGHPLGSSHKDRIPDIKTGASNTDSIPRDNGALENSRERVCEDSACLPRSLERIIVGH